MGAQVPSPILGLMASWQVEGQTSPTPVPPGRTPTLHRVVYTLMFLEIHSFNRSPQGRACNSHLSPNPGLGTHMMRLATPWHRLFRKWLDSEVLVGEEGGERLSPGRLGSGAAPGPRVELSRSGRPT